MVWIIFGLLGLAGIGLWVHHVFEGERLIVDIWREWRLSRHPLKEWDARWQARAKKSDIIVSMTTIPSRIGMMDTALKSLLDQTLPPSQIFINVPLYSKREDCAYEVPPYLENLAGVTIKRCEDWGPATKLIPTLTEVAPDQAILVADDDRIYPRDLVETYERQLAKTPDVALTMAGWDVPDDLVDRPTTIWSNLMMLAPAPIRGSRLRTPREIDIIQGVMSYVMRPRFFELRDMTDFQDTPRAGFLADDVRTSALCQVPKHVVPTKGLSFLPKCNYAEFKRTALANLNRGTGALEDRNNTIAIRHYASRWKCTSSDK